MSQTNISTDDCWLYAGYKTSDGYGIYRITINGKTYPRRIHRLMYETLVGEIPDGLVIDHLCRVRHCVNPKHLEPVTNKENILRGIGAGAWNSAKTHCKQGHEYTPENTMRQQKGRRCRTCHNRWVNRNYHKNYYKGKFSKEYSQSFN